MLTSDVALAAYFDAVVEAGVAPKTAANWITGEFSRLLNQHAADALRADHVALRPQGLAELIGEVESGSVSSTNAKMVLAAAFESGESPRKLIEAQGLGQVSDAGTIGSEIDSVLAEFSAQVEEYRSGKVQLFGFLVGQVMKRTAGRADARLVNEELRRRLDAEIQGAMVRYATGAADGRRRSARRSRPLLARGLMGSPGMSPGPRRGSSADPVAIRRREGLARVFPGRARVHGSRRWRPRPTPADAAALALCPSGAPPPATVEPTLA